jgi:L-rhamnose-H+ transport protein
LDANPFLGVVLHAIGGLAAGSFYIPFKKVRNWSWESYWLVGGVFSWILAPWVVAFLAVPDLGPIFREAPRGSILQSYLFGVLWGIGGLTFGLSVRYVGMSLGYALSLGFCAAFGTIIPGLFNIEQFTFDRDKFELLTQTKSGLTTLGGVGVCLAGIAVCGLAGIFKERELSSEAKRATIREFSFVKGFWVAVFAGVMSACMAFGFASGKPIADLAVEHHVTPLWKNTPVLIVVLAGGFTTNFIWCLILNLRNRSGHDYTNAAGAPLVVNYVFSALAGVTWYLQFMFYGMGTTKMGRYDFSSWTIHMSFIIVFSNLWALGFHEWKGSSCRTLRMVIIGIVVLIAATLVIGYGNFLAAQKS